MFENYEKLINVNDLRILTDDEIMKIYKIISNDEEIGISRANSLYSFISIYDFEYTLIKRKDVNPEIKYMMDCISNFISYTKNNTRIDYIPFSETLKVFKSKLENLLKAINVLNSEKTDYSKAIEIFQIFPKLSNLTGTIQSIKYALKRNLNLDFANNALKDNDKLLLFYKRMMDEKSTLKFYDDNNGYFESYPYSKTIIEYYINYNKSFDLYEFLKDIGLSKREFDQVVAVVEFANIDLYNRYLLKLDYNNKQLVLNYKNTFDNLAYGIINGVMRDGTPFDILLFVKLLPFRYSENQTADVIKFVEKNCIGIDKIIINYIYKNNILISKHSCEKYITRTKTCKFNINGHVTEKEDNEKIIEYLIENKIPVIPSTFYYARDLYFTEPDLFISKVKSIKK